MGFIEEKIQSRNADVKIVRVIIPGNHDCNFLGDQGVRDLVLDSLTEDSTLSESFREVTLEPLSEYFNIVESFTSNTHAISKSQPFYNTVDIFEGDLVLRLHLLNTAWMSSIHERPGSLHFPLSEIKSPSENMDCSIAILHHPINWFSQPSAMRPLRDRLSQLASVVLVNHEHTAEAMEQTLLFGTDDAAIKSKMLYVSGGVIQEGLEAEPCNFNVLRIEIPEKLLHLSRFDYRTNKGKPYFERTATETASLSATLLNTGPEGIPLSEDMAAFLKDPGAPIVHPLRDIPTPILLSDIFIYPDLWEINSEHRGNDQKQIKSKNIVEEVFSTPKVLITGEDSSGKTSLLKNLFMDAFNAGKIPLLLVGSELPKKSGQLRALIQNTVVEQYSNLTADAYEQLESSKRILLIDDIHQAACDSSSPSTLY